jgi:hypothetical protein
VLFVSLSDALDLGDSFCWALLFEVLVSIHLLWVLFVLVFVVAACVRESGRVWIRGLQTRVFSPLRF